MHDEIVKFSREGEIRDDSVFIRIKEELIRNVHQEMNDCGFVPVLDLSPHWSTEYMAEKKRYSFKLTVYGVSLGGVDCKGKGMDGGRIIRIA